MDKILVSELELEKLASGVVFSQLQGEWGWTQPLKLLVRKGLTVSDVGELGRIIVPKKDAESQCFPQIDTKEGRVLEMEDFTACKRWYFRFKYWINNKSRMYVLENTGDFIKFHCLKEHDTFVIYEDGCKKLIVCGQKKENGDSLDPVLERSKSSITETPPPTTTHHHHRR
jgi:bifunctional DNA-binding transcriptional regulator/antitoxin component of YhaV-PrlF toxin-antitoxin module